LSGIDIDSKYSATKTTHPPQFGYPSCPLIVDYCQPSPKKKGFSCGKLKLLFFPFFCYKSKLITKS